MVAERPGERVRRLRTQRGLSQNDLAQRLGVTRQQVYQVERGTQQHMRPGTLSRYAEALNVSERYLDTGIDFQSGPLPPIEEYLRIATSLSEEDARTVARIVRALESQQGVDLRAERRRTRTDASSEARPVS
jgi:transcriptional regulator with XRE-family HTH domain